MSTSKNDVKDEKLTKEDAAYQIVTRSKSTKPGQVEDVPNVRRKTNKDEKMTRSKSKRKASAAQIDTLVPSPGSSHALTLTPTSRAGVGTGTSASVESQSMVNVVPQGLENCFILDKGGMSRIFSLLRKRNNRSAISDEASSEVDDVDVDDDDDDVDADDSGDADDVDDDGDDDDDEEYNEEDCKVVENSELSRQLKDKILSTMTRRTSPRIAIATGSPSPTPTPTPTPSPSPKPKREKKVKPPPKNQWSEELEQIWKDERKRYKTTETKEKLEKLNTDVLTLSNALETDMPSLKKILESDLDEESKKELMPLYVIYDSMMEPSFEKLLIRGKIVEKIKSMRLAPECLQTKKKLAEVNQYTRSLEETILSLDIPLKDKAIIYKKYSNWTDMSTEEGNNDEVKSKLKEWIDYAIRLPTKVKPLLQGRVDRTKDGAPDMKTIAECLIDIRTTLDNHLYGMKKEKEELLLIINNMLSNPECKNLNLGFVGKAGVGKTALIRTLAKALDIPFIHISLGGCRDSAFLDGHSYTYEGSQPGILVKSLCSMGNKNGIMYFDEIDKLETSHGKEVMWTLLHIWDPTQNMEFRDKYLDELTVDLSHIWFMFSMNDEKRLDKILLDRMHVIHVSNYTKKDKLEIIKRFTIPDALKNIDPNLASAVIIPDETIQHLINIRAENIPDEYGMRGLNRDITTMLRRVSILKNIASSPPAIAAALDFTFQITNVTFPFTITIPVMEKFLTEKHGFDSESNEAWRSMML
jgi:ATP-dependent Lon protease